MGASETLLAGCSVLVVDDHDPTRNLLENYLGGLQCRVASADGGDAALQAMREREFDLVVLDLRMDDMDGLEVLKQARQEGLAPNFIMMSAEGTIAHAVEAIRLGAADFLVKPFELDQLMELAGRVLGRATGDPDGGPDPRLAWRDTYAPDLVGEHESLKEIFLVLERIAPTDCTVLITGESGTGKELVARAIHNASTRTDRAFVPVNCGAIPETLIESELFGHAKGAFSGATASREGRFAAADQGTLFLDEIGEMALPVQVKFLRVLQEGEYVPVGETRPRKCDVRTIAATNRNLHQMAQQGAFREDLFYRLNLIPIQLPPLRDRRSDIPILGHHFLAILQERRGLQVRDFSEEAMARMMRHDWPGNVRELENVVERMVLLHRGSGILDVADLSPSLQAQSAGDGTAATSRHAAGAAGNEPVADPAPPPEPPPASPPSSPDSPAAVSTPAPAAGPPFRCPLPEDGLDLRATVEAFEMDLIDQALERTGGNKNQASILLGMNRTTLVEKLRKRKRQRDKQ